MGKSTTIGCFTCIVYLAGQVSHFTTIDAQTYWRSPECNAIFLDHTHFSSARVEHEHSLGHDNRADEPAYKKFLSQLTTPLLTQLKLGEKVLVLGCGPSPAEAAMRSERGFSMALAIRFPSDKSSLQSIWDFITCTETAEHFHDPFF